MTKRPTHLDEMDKSLTELEGKDWGQPTYDSHLVTSVHALRHKPIGQFTNGDLRLTLGQRVGVRFLLPIALERLAEDPLCEGDYYPGDLLAAVLHIESDWPPDANTLDRVRALVMRAVSEHSDRCPEQVAREFAEWLTRRPR